MTLHDYTGLYMTLDSYMTATAPWRQGACCEGKAHGRGYHDVGTPVHGMAGRRGACACVCVCVPSVTGLESTVSTTSVGPAGLGSDAHTLDHRVACRRGRAMSSDKRNEAMRVAISRS